ncbi:hypothetical protein LC082_05520 [Microbacterium esteraromaticum]|uniref:hypothetical protein n=1 Tax=Microbacterium esteraromaticum TaxID=57043 RepID=UPI001CD4D1A6|nr:hypothetical protein [Microbacterium esteraromaticum]MCA1306355.1 hypothetical protein [Microbacterium esteraromaticum]
MRSLRTAAVSALLIPRCAFFTVGTPRPAASMLSTKRCTSARLMSLSRMRPRALGATSFSK